MRHILLTLSLMAAACGAQEQPSTNAGHAGSGSAGSGGSGKPKVVKDDTRDVTAVDLTSTENIRNACSAGITKYLTQFSIRPGSKACGQIPDEQGDLTGQKSLAIPDSCTLGHFYNVDAACTVSTDMTCMLPNGCTETRHLDFSWTPATLPDALETPDAFLGDGELTRTLTCPGKPMCSDSWTQITFNRI
jgi:hypothetical protein